VLPKEGSGAKVGNIQIANNKMAEELEKVNSDLAQALRGLQEVREVLGSEKGILWPL
jgi:hypothetical protein